MMINYSRLFEKIWKPSQERFLSEENLDAESKRHELLIMGFSSVGGLFSILYAFYYVVIGHHNGAIAILFNSLLFITLPFFYLKRGKPDLSALIFVFSLLSMFTWLSLIEGGVTGHAVAWLATMPFCTQLLILKRKAALWISGLSVLLVAVISGLEIIHLQLPILYAKEDHGWVTMVGYTGLAIFMFSLGSIVEYYRRKVMRERDQAEKELNDAVTELTKLNLEKNEFLGIAAHDLNNPLSVIYGYTDILQNVENLSAEGIKGYVNEIAMSSQRMQKIIQDILDVNTIESGKYPLTFEIVSLGPLIASCLNTYRESLKKKNLQVQKYLSDTELETDSGALGQVLDNLISNAIKYTPPGGQISVRISENPEKIWIEVFNEGRGLSEEDKSKLFSRFAKLSTRPTAGEGSVGLGLSITQKIVEAMGGAIECESELNQGATFRVTLPRSQSFRLLP